MSARAGVRRAAYGLLASTVMAVALALPAAAGAQPGFETGPVIDGFGPAVAVPEATFNLVPDTQYRLLFDVATGSRDSHERNRGLESAARFLNMHARSDIDPDDLEIEIVTHGGTVFDMLSDEAYRQRFDRPNPNSGLLAALSEAGVAIRLCGQSAAAHGIAAGELAPGVELAVSAMTVLVRRQAEGWVLLP